jgi:hypothetical protein
LQTCRGSGDVRLSECSIESNTSDGIESEPCSFCVEQKANVGEDDAGVREVSRSRSGPGLTPRSSSLTNEDLDLRNWVRSTLSLAQTLGPMGSVREGQDRPSDSLAGKVNWETNLIYCPKSFTEAFIGILEYVIKKETL